VTNADIRPFFGLYLDRSPECLLGNQREVSFGKCQTPLSPPSLPAPDIGSQQHQWRRSPRQNQPTAHTMASEDVPNPMAESGVTMRSDSEQYSNGEDVSVSPPSSSSPAIILYQPPTIWSLLRGAAINLFLPFVNGMMLGFGELFAHEAAFRLGWSGTRASSAVSPFCRRISKTM